jgi:hypothetical protein
MKKMIPFVSAAILTTTALGPAQAQEELIYVAVEPCRIVDTRKSTMGVINANTSRNFLVAGTAEEMAVQGGVADCLNPKGADSPAAISAYILAVPASSSTGRGVLTAYPSDLPLPPPGTGSTVNFTADGPIGNTTNVTVCNDGDCPSDGELAILARNTDEHVVVDVQGYFYPVVQRIATGYILSGPPLKAPTYANQGVWTVSEINAITARITVPGGCADSALFPIPIISAVGSQSPAFLVRSECVGPDWIFEVHHRSDFTFSFIDPTYRE